MLMIREETLSLKTAASLEAERSPQNVKSFLKEEIEASHIG